jgi:hypothetical protein
MALTAAQTASVYEAVGLKGGGGTYAVIRFDAFSVNDIQSTPLTWDYANAKTKVDACIAQAIASVGGEVRLQTHVANFDKWQPYQSVKLQGEVTFDAGKEFEKARGRIIDICAVEIVPIPLAEAIKKAATGDGFSGTVSR